MPFITTVTSVINFTEICPKICTRYAILTINIISLTLIDGNLFENFGKSV